MDAANALLKKTALLLPLALFALAPVIQAQSFNPIAPQTITSTGGLNVLVTSSGSAITFTTFLVNSQAPAGDPSVWLSVSSGGTTPANITVTPVNLGSQAGTYTATIGLRASSPAGVADSTFTVTYVSGSGGGGGGGGSTGVILATPNPVQLQTNTNNAVFQPVNLTTTSTAPISFNVTFTPLSSWLTAGSANTFVSSASPATLTVGATTTNLPNGSYNGQVIVTPTSGGAATTIPVTLTVGTGGGTGSLTASPNPVNLSYTSNSGLFPNTNVVLQSLSGATTYTATASSSNGWLLVNGNPSATGIIPNLVVSVSGNVGALTTGNYQGQIQVTDSNSGTVSIQVNLAVNGGSTAGLTFNPPSGLTFTSAVGGTTTASQQVSITSQTSGSLSVSCTSSPQTWLTCSGSPGTINANSPQAITLTATPGSLPAGSYFGQLSATVNGIATGSVSITFIVGGGGSGGGSTNLSVAPTALAFSYESGTPISNVARQMVAFTGPTGSAWSATTSTTNGGTWLQLGTILGNLGGDGTGTSTVIINPSGLAAGTYNGTVSINFTSTGASQTVAVSLTVVASGTPILLPTPGSAVFNYHSGDTLQPQAIFLAASDGSAVAASAATTTSWITVSQTAGSGSFAISVNPAGMASGLYTGSVTVTQSGLANSPLAVPVVLIVNGGGSTGGGGALTLSPATLTFNAAVGINPGVQTISIGASVTTNFTVTATTSTGQNWLNLDRSSGAAPTSMSVFVTSTSLPVGTYSGIITYTVNGVNQTVPVTLNVSTTGAAGGNVTATPTALTFTGQAGGASLAGQTLNISSATGSASVAFTLSTSGGTWLTVSTQSSATPSTPTVNVNIAGLAAGTYSGSVIITPTGGTVVSVPVTLTVTAPSTVSASPTSLSFTYRVGDPPPAGQAVNVTGGTGLSFAATASSNGNWLGVSPASGSTPGAVTVFVNPPNLNASTTPYTGTVTVAGSGTATGTTTINVSLTVTAPLPTVTKLTNAASFSSGSISPGEIITLFGTGIGPTPAVGLTLNSSGGVSTSIGGVQVTVNGFNCPMVFASATQVSAVVPYEIAGFAGADVLVKFVGQSSNAIHVNVSTTAPGVFTANSSGSGPGAILNSNNSVNSPSNPAARGDTVVVYLTGEGQTSPAGVTGKVTTVSSTPPLTPAPLLQVSVLIGPPGAQQPANFSFAGEAPGIVSGALQLNVQIPTTVAAGDQPIVVSIGGNPSQSGVTVSVK